MTISLVVLCCLPLDPSAPAVAIAEALAGRPESLAAVTSETGVLAAALSHTPPVTTATRGQLVRVLRPAIADAREITKLLQAWRRNAAEARLVIDSPDRVTFAITSRTLDHGCIEFSCRTAADGRREVVDLVDQRQQLVLSQQLADAAAAVVIASQPQIGGLPAADRAALEPLALRHRMTTLRKSATLADYDAAVAALPPAVRADPSVRLGRVLVAVRGDDLEQTIASIRDARRSPSLATTTDTLIAGYGLRAGLFEEALGAATRLRRQQPRNPHWPVLQAAAFIRLGDADRALAALDKATAIAPNRPTSYLTLLAHSLDAGDAEFTTRVLGEFERSDRFALRPLGKLPGYRDFLTTPEGRAWKRHAATGRSITL